jgi:5-methylcytosine-specific restriction endonuclease McrA
MAFFDLSMDYKSKRWLCLRDAILRRDGYRCREASRYGRNEMATTVHHVYPVDDFPGWQWCRWNLIAVSQQAHNSFHDRATGKLTERGLAWQRRVIPPLDSPPPF